MSERTLDADVIIVGGGPAGATLGTLLAQNGFKALIIEKDIHPRDHVGESLVPSTNLVFHRIGFLDKLNDAGFIPKPGTCWKRAFFRRRGSTRLPASSIRDCRRC